MQALSFFPSPHNPITLHPITLLYQSNHLSEQPYNQCPTAAARPPTTRSASLPHRLQPGMLHHCASWANSTCGECKDTCDDGQVIATTRLRRVSTASSPKACIDNRNHHLELGITSTTATNSTPVPISMRTSDITATPTHEPHSSIGRAAKAPIRVCVNHRRYSFRSAAGYFQFRRTRMDSSVPRANCGSRRNSSLFGIQRRTFGGERERERERDTGSLYVWCFGWTAI
ncbi:hypothetical protein FN846DRAFT_944597, partial [Sphaerosporella brunnea]